MLDLINTVVGHWKELCTLASMATIGIMYTLLKIKSSEVGRLKTAQVVQQVNQNAIGIEQELQANEPSLIELKKELQDAEKGLNLPPLN